MIYRFYAKADELANVPDAPVALGQPIARIGRTFVMPKDGENFASMPATQEPHEVDDKLKDAKTVEAYRDHARRGHVFCADEATARACGVDFVPVEFADGAWMPKASPVAAPVAVAATVPAPAPAVEKRSSRKEAE